MTRPSSHDDKITVNVALSDLPPTQQGFSTLLLLVPLADNSLNGARVATYSSGPEAQAALTAGYISATTLARITTVFAQRASNGRSPEQVKVGNVNLAGSTESYADGYDACIVADSDFYAVCIEARTDAELANIAARVEAVGEHLVGLVSADAGWLSSGAPSALASLATFERTVPYYHDTADAYADVGHMASRLMFDPDEQSAGWQGQVRGVAGLTTPLTATQKGFLRANNMNVALPFGTVSTFVDPGWTAMGRPVYEVVTADWLRARVREDLAAEVIASTDRGEKIIVDASGQAKVMAIIEARLEQGERADHFVAGQTLVNPVPITADDRTSEKLRFTGSGQRGTDARLFDFDFTISTDPVIVTEG